MSKKVMIVDVSASGRLMVTLTLEEGRRAGAGGWIVKPGRPNQLPALVNKVLG